MKDRCSAISVSSEITLYHQGPPLDYGPLPSLFYFAISGPDSLCLDPFNQPVVFLQNTMIRVFSLTLPAHEEGLDPKNAMHLWAEDLQKKRNSIPDFLQKASDALDFAIREKFVDPHHLGVAGLSRGAFIAAHLAAREDRFRFVLGFAPLTTFRTVKEFETCRELDEIGSFDLLHQAKALAHRPVQLFIGNEDERVGTRECFEFAMQIVAHKPKRVSQVELLIYPSVGHLGHGTPPEIFKKGADWVLSQMKV